MTRAKPHARYVAAFAVGLAAAVSILVALNFALGLRSLGNAELVHAAAAWQQETRGITYAPPEAKNGPFKYASLAQRLPDVDVIVLGSSTMMGVTASMFPPTVHVYNLAQSSNRLITVLSELDAQQSTGAKFKFAVIPLDWALGFIYDAGAPQTGAHAVSLIRTIAQPERYSFKTRLFDAMSMPRLRHLRRVGQYIISSSNPVAAFDTVFLKSEGNSYVCPNGAIAKDFDTLHPMQCAGFRYDGSATFAHLAPVDAASVERRIDAALRPTSRYWASLAHTQGRTNRALLDAVARLARNASASGGELLLIMPPLLPGLERAFANTSPTSGWLAHTKQELHVWAQEARVRIVDAGRSEDYGCDAAEFVDEHHALPSCYARVFEYAWAARAGDAGAGLHSPPAALNVRGAGYQGQSPGRQN